MNLRKNGSMRQMRWLFTLCLSCLLTGVAFAQKRTVSGTIKTKDGEVLPGVTISVLNAKGDQGSAIRGTSSDFDGNFSVMVDGDNQVLLFSYIGFKQQRIIVANKTVVNITLEEEANEIDEVILIGYGTTTRGDATGATATVKQEAIERTQMNSIAEVVEGRVAGVQVTTSDGTPGGGFKINIRGAAGISASSEPLYVIDGFPYENDEEANEFDTGYEGAADNNPLNFIDPNNIESIEILKDASATAIYGDRGANGVVIINTKLGKIGKPSFTYTSNFAFSSVPDERIVDMIDTDEYYQMKAYTDFYNQYRQGLNPDGTIDENSDENILLTQEFVDWVNRDVVDEEDLLYQDFKTLDVLLAERAAQAEGLPSTDWQRRLFKLGVLSSHSLSVSGGDEKNRYNLTGSYLNNKGVVTNSGFERFAFNAKFKNELSEKLIVSTVLTPTLTKRFGAGGGGGNLQNNFGLFLRTLQARPFAGAEFAPDNGEDGEFVDDDGAQFFEDPLYQAENVENENMGYGFRGNIKFDYQIIDGLKATVMMGIGTNGTFVKTFNPPTFGQGARPQNQGQVIRNINRSFDYVNNNLLNYKGSIGGDKKHKINALVGFTQQSKIIDRLRVETRNFDVDHSGGANNIQAGTEPQQSKGRYIELNRMGILSRLNYVYDGKYSVTASLRRDGNSRFSKERRWGNFPSAAFAWTISKEPFLKKVKAINNLKWRLSYGLVGSSGVRSDRARPELAVANYHFGQEAVAGYQNIVNVDPNLTWQTSSQYNTGIDASFFKNRVKFTFDAYLRQTRDMLLEKPLPLSSGFDVRMENAGDIDNWGYEFALRTDNIKTKDFSWFTNFNISFDRSKVLSLGGVDFQLFNQRGVGGSSSVVLKVGENLGSWYGYDQVGVYQESDFDIVRNADGFIESMTLKDGVADDIQTTGTRMGDPKFRDINGDGKITPDDRTVIARYQPDFYGGMYNQFKYKDFTLGIQATFKYGYDVVNGNRWRFSYAQKDINNLAENLNAWTPDNTNTMLPRYGLIDSRLTSRHVEDGSFIRINTISLKYNLRSEMLKNAFFRSMQFSLNFDNAFLFTKYSGSDPETSVGGGRYKFLSGGLDYGAYPRSRNVRVGLKVQF